MLYIDPYGVIQHGSNGEWIEFCDLFGNESILKKDTWTRKLPNVVKASFALSVFRSPREEKASRARGIFSKIRSLYTQKWLCSTRNLLLKKDCHLPAPTPLLIAPQKRSHLSWHLTPLTMTVLSKHPTPNPTSSTSPPPTPNPPKSKSLRTIQIALRTN